MLTIQEEKSGWTFKMYEKKMRRKQQHRDK